MALIQWKQIDPRLLGNGQLTGSLEVSGSIILNGVPLTTSGSNGGIGTLPDGVISGSAQIAELGYATTSSVIAVDARVDTLSSQTGSYLTSLSSSNIQDLNNVSTAGIIDGQVLAYDSASGTFVPSSAGQGDITSVYAGIGLDGGGTTGVVALEVVPGDGINVDLNGVHLDTGSTHFTDALAAINYAGIFKQTGSIYATTNDLEVTGSLTLEYDGSTDPLKITSSSKELFSINGEGVLKLISQSGTPNPVEGGIYFGNDGNFYFGS